MRFAVSVWLFFVSVLVCEPGFAGYKMGENRPVRTSDSGEYQESDIAIDRATNRRANSVAFPRRDGPTSNPEGEVIGALAQRYSVPPERIQYYRTLRYGYEEIVPSLVVAREAQVEVGRVLKMRMEGESWPSIASSFAVNLKPLNREVLDILKPIQRRLPKRALTERPENMLKKAVNSSAQQKK